jgi:MoaA/NifB/PqqE/SkfB family radical SAM enzyme
LTCEEWFEVIRQLGDLGFVKLNFMGGEPLLRPDAADIIGFASSHTDAELQLNTNGILLTPAKIRELIEAGVRSFNVSFDGATPEMHDHIRGQKKAFARTLENFHELVRLRDAYRLKLRIFFTVMRVNVSELVEIAKLAQALKVRLSLNVLTDHTFLFRGHNITRLGEIDQQALDHALNEFLVLKRERPEFLPRYSVICCVGDHFQDQLQQELPCVEAYLKLMVHSRGQAGGCWAHDPEFSLRTESVQSILSSVKSRERRTDFFFKRCRGCGCNHALNLRLDQRALLYDALWCLGIFRKRRKIYAKLNPTLRRAGAGI